MPNKDVLRRWGQRLFLSFVSSISVSVTAFACAWFEYRNTQEFRWVHAEEDPSIWHFATAMDTGGIQLTCLLAGALAFPLCLIYSAKLEGTRSSLVKVLIANTVTALFAILAAVVMAAFHLPPPPFDHH